jgi:hypothetical protein
MGSCCQSKLPVTRAMESCDLMRSDVERRFMTELINRYRMGPETVL